MFGHVDAGVLHVRPALDLKDPRQAALVRPISDQVAALTQKYGGLLWGEHGKGVRSEYAPAFFGDLYPALQALKGAFDPHNQLNRADRHPLASGAELLKVDGVTLSGELDRTLDERVWQSYGTAMHCNGNGACYNYDPDDAIVPVLEGHPPAHPFAQGPRRPDRRMAAPAGPGGIDVLAPAPRECAELAQGPAAAWRNGRQAEADFSHEVYDAMAGCLACKSCAGQVPDQGQCAGIPLALLELYHRRYLRPVPDYLIGSLEFSLPLFARAPGLYNAVMGATPIPAAVRERIGMVDSPLLSRFDLVPVMHRCGRSRSPRRSGCWR